MTSGPRTPRQDRESPPGPPEPGGDGEGPGPRPPSSGARRWLRRAAVAAVALAVLYGALAAAFRVLLDPGRVSAWLEPRLEAAVNRDVALEGARPSLFPGLGVDLTGLRVENLPDFEGPPLARVDRVRLRVALLPLLRGRIRVDEVRVESPRIRLAVDGTGTSNFGDLVPASREEDAPGVRRPLELRVRDLRVSDGRVEYASAPDTVYGALVGIRASASLGRGAQGVWSVALETSSEAVELEHPALDSGTVRLVGPMLETRASLDPDGGRLVLEEGELRVADAAFRLAGRVEGLDEPLRRLDLSLGAEGLALERLATALPSGARDRVPGTPSGSLRLELAVRGEAGPDVRPVVRGRAEVEGAGFEASDGTVLARSVAGRIVLSGDTLRVEELAGTVLGGPFSLSAEVAVDSALPARGRLEMRPDLERARTLAALPEGVELGGRVGVATGFAGSLRRPADVLLDGELRLRGLHVVHPRLGVPVEVAEADVDLSGRRVSWSDVAVSLGTETVRASGSLQDPLAPLGGDDGRVPILEARLNAPRLTLDRILPPRGDPRLTYGRIAFARLGGRELDGRSADDVARSRGLSRPDALPLRGRLDVAVDSLVSEPYGLADVRVRADGGPGLLQVPDASFELFGGRGSASFRLGLGPDALQPFDFTLSVDGTRAADFLARTTPLGRRIRGSLALELRAGGALDSLLLPVASSLGGGGRVGVQDGGMEETPVTALLARSLSLPGLAAPSFRDWTAGFDVEGSRLVLREGRLATGVGELLFDGSVGLDGALDLGLRLAVSGARLDSLALGRAGLAPGVVGRLSGASPVRIGLRLGGTVTDPNLRPEASLAAGSVRDAVEREVEERAGAARDTAEARLRQARDSAAARLEAERRQARQQLEERARGFLRGFLGRRDTARADTLVPEPFPAEDTVPADTLQTETPANDTGAPDTARPDTAAPDTAGGRFRTP